MYFIITFVLIPTLLRSTLLDLTLLIWYYHLLARLIVYYIQGHLFIHQTLSPYLYDHILITNLKCVFNRRSLTYQLRSNIDDVPIYWKADPYNHSNEEFETWSQSYDSFCESRKKIELLNDYLCTLPESILFNSLMLDQYVIKLI